ncbi:hypothetical protein FF2_018556 [Malus domestica]
MPSPSTHAYFPYVRINLQDQVLMALEEASNPIQDQASTTLEEITSTIQNQVSITFESNPAPYKKGVSLNNLTKPESLPTQFKNKPVESQQLEETRKSSNPVQERPPTQFKKVLQPSSRKACGKSTIGGNQKVLQPSSRKACGKSTIGGNQKVFQPSSRISLSKVNN